jgi:hypothetical protein
VTDNGHTRAEQTAGQVADEMDWREQLRRIKAIVADVIRRLEELEKKVGAK